MNFYSRKWKNCIKSDSIEDYIRTYEERIKILKRWKEKGIYLDTNKKKDENDSVTFYTTNLQVANEENFILDESKSEIQYHTYKIGVYSRYKIIREQFIKAIHAIGDSRGKDYFLSYKYQKNHYAFKFHFLTRIFRHESGINITLRSEKFQGIIHFYHIKDEINKKIVPFLKQDSRIPVSILFVGYDSILPPNPEEVDQNIQIIKETTKISNSCYISADDPDSMFQVIDKMIEIIY